MSRYVNAAFYKFCPVENPLEKRSALRALGNELGLRGTIILAKEGINAAFAGEEAGVQAMVAHLERFCGPLDVKSSYSDKLPFRRFLAKVKAEIIPLGIEDLNPEKNAAAYVEAAQLQEWYEKGEDFVILDTRNDYEVKLGTFRGAVDPELKTFREFPEWVRKNFAEYKKKKVVTFCTGGIRCEKATAFMRAEGFEDVYQLHGGILRYFEETQNSKDNFYDGDCFVFDHRVAVNSKLEKTVHALCFTCWAPLTPEDMESQHYIPEKQCPHCMGLRDVRRKERQERAREEHLRVLKERSKKNKEARAKQG